MKEYFSHDHNARNDGKLLRLQMKHGMEGLGIFWCLCEMLAEEDGYLMRSECERIAFELRTSCEKVASVIDDFGLFEMKGEMFYSESMLRRLEVKWNKSKKAKESAEARWNRQNENTIGMRTHSEGNAIKLNEMKVNEKKGKEIKEKTVSNETGIVLKKKAEVQFSHYPESIRKIVEVWLNYRREIKKPILSQKSLDLWVVKLEKLSGGSLEKAAEIVATSMANQWQGIFASNQRNAPKDGKVLIKDLTYNGQAPKTTDVWKWQ